ncbi:MAG: hypothetical protein MJ136_03490 [Clostridia bacterium]|nr:hypothetical protein [Clostridia bacterium]
MKKFFAALLVMAMLLCSVSALAEWPERAIELIVPANPGGDTDANARALAAALNQEYGWNVIVSNMNGGSGAVAFEDLMNNPDPGYRFVFYHSGACTTELMEVYTFSVCEAFKLVGMPILDFTSAFLINTNNSKFNDIPSLVDYMKAHPGEVTFATELGNFTHLHALAFQAAAGVEFAIEDHGTASQKIVDLLGDRVDVIDTQAGLGTIKDNMAAGNMICLAIMAQEALAAAPELHTFTEYGYDVVFPKFFYVAAPNECDDAIVDAFNAKLATVIANADLNTFADAAYLSLTSMSPAETEAYYTEQMGIYESYLADFLGD